MNPRSYPDVDQMLSDVMARTSDGLNFETAADAINDGIKAIRAMMAALAAKDFADMDGPQIARSASQAMKSLDDLYRLVQFGKGAPDSRPDLGGDWLRGLTGEQLRMVEGFIAQNGAKEAK